MKIDRISNVLTIILTAFRVYTTSATDVLASYMADVVEKVWCFVLSGSDFIH